jgi:hypothetical protein
VGGKKTGKATLAFPVFCALFLDPPGSV